METNNKQSLFTAVSQEESATVCGGVSLSAILNYLNTSTLTVTDTEPNTSNSTSTPVSVSQTGVLSASNGPVSISVSLVPGNLNLAALLGLS